MPATASVIASEAKQSNSANSVFFMAVAHN